MAITITCDGCGKKVEQGAKQVGLYKKVEYCADCLEVYRQFLSRRDAKVSGIAEEMERWLGIERGLLKKQKGLGKLPDE